MCLEKKGRKGSGRRPATDLASYPLASAAADDGQIMIAAAASSLDSESQARHTFSSQLIVHLLLSLGVGFVRDPCLAHGWIEHGTLACTMKRGGRHGNFLC